MPKKVEHVAAALSCLFRSKEKDLANTNKAKAGTYHNPKPNPGENLFPSACTYKCQTPKPKVKPAQTLIHPR